MKKRHLLLSLLTFICVHAFAVTQTDTAIVVNSKKHSLYISTPNGYNSDVKYPLVIGLHYCGGTAVQFLNAMQRFSDSLKVIVACPDYSSDRVPASDTNMFGIVADTMFSMFSIDSAEIYLTGMSCNSDFGLQQGLAGVYPFKGIFPWAPWSSTSSPQYFNYNSTQPTIISIGTNDPKLQTVLNIYDSLKTHNANINLILAKDIGHTLDFNGFGSIMIKSFRYLNDTGAISIGEIQNFSMPNDSSCEITFTVESELNANIQVRMFSSNPNIIPDQIATKIGVSSEYKITIPPSTRWGNVTLVVEASDDSGINISQSTFSVKVTKAISTDISNEVSPNPISIYPSPSKGRVFVENAPDHAQIELIDMNGRLIHSQECTQNKIDFPTAIKPGVYSLKIISNKGIDSHTIIVE